MIAKLCAATASLARARARHGAVLALLLAGGAHQAVAAGSFPQLVEFDQYSSQASFGELARRLQSPFDAEKSLQGLRDSGGSPASQIVDLATEKFLVRVPSRRPDPGYALLVFVPPWQEARLPWQWAPVLDQRGVLFVTAARSGNHESVFGRREPLALLAAYNLMQRYPIDPRRVYVAGFSGGARVALRLALGYPDVFRGALLNAGSDAVGDANAVPPIPLPPRELLYQFQESSRLVYATGELDVEHVADDRSSVRSLAQWCIYDRYQFELPRLEHAPADGGGLARALDALDARGTVDLGRLGRCRDTLQAELDAKFRTVATLLADGQRDAADRLLGQIDRRYGGLAAPRSVEMLHEHSTGP
jgi:pimeloyl-ACP methyl ester carboxylesterase